MSDIDDRITAIFRDVFRNDQLALADATTPADVPGWDSLANVNLITALESEFDIKLGVRDVMKMTSVGEIRRVVQSKVTR